MKLLLIFYSILCFFIAPGNEWTEKLNKNGVVVYLRPSDNSKVKSTKSVVTINASAEKIKSVILDIANYPEWVFKCTKTSVLSKTNNKDIYYYQYTDAPFPVSDRDMVLLLTESEKENEITITIKSQPDKIPKNDGVVRVKLFDSTWRIRKVKDKTEVTNEITTDPGGSVPAWLINSVITTGPYNTMLYLKQIAEKN